MGDCRLPMVDFYFPSADRWKLKRAAARVGQGRRLRVSEVPWCFGLVILLTLLGCRGRDDGSSQSGGSVKTVEDQGVKVTLATSTGEVEMVKPVQVTLDVVADPTIQVGIENYGHALTEGDRAFQFRVVRSHEEIAKLTSEGKRRWLFTYDLEFVLPEQYELPPAIVKVAGTGADAATADAASRELKTDPLPILVKSSTAALTAEDLKKIRMLDPRELPRILARWWWVAALAVGGGGLLFLILRRRRAPHAERGIVVPAHEWAYREFARLSADHLVDQGRIQEFFYRISGVVRGYVERRFAVRAPEMTTEEFLETMARDSRFGINDRGEISSFLKECDLVKYARYEASRSECDTVQTAARRYVDQTREQSHPRGEPMAAASSLREAGT